MEFKPLETGLLKVGYIRMCSICRRIYLNGEWIGEEDERYSKYVACSNGQKTDGLCNWCEETFYNPTRVRRERREITQLVTLPSLLH